VRLTAFTRRIGFFRVCITHLFPYQRARIKEGHPITAAYFMTGDGRLTVGESESDCMAGDFVDLAPEMRGKEMIGFANDAGASWLAFREVQGHSYKIKVIHAEDDFTYFANEDAIIVSLFADLMINSKRHNVTDWRKIEAGQSVKINGHAHAVFAVVVETDEGSDEILREVKS